MRNYPKIHLSRLALFILCLFCSADFCLADSGESRYGVIQNIAEDRRVERIGGIYEPEGLDKYMKRRFDALDGRLDELNSRIDQIQKTLKEISAQIEKKQMPNKEENMETVARV